MNKLSASIVLVVVIVGALVAFQATRESSRSVLLPEQVLALGDRGRAKRIRVAGRVSSKAGVFYRVTPEAMLSFSLVDPADEEEVTKLTVVYKGVKPDMFSEGRDVIVDGEFLGGELHASKLMTQCPSKYDPPVAPVQREER